MAEYLVLIYGDEAKIGAAGQPLWDELMQGHGAFGEKYGAVLSGGNALQDAATATSIRKQEDGSFAVTDGPFAETKEALGGYYLIKAADLDEAISVAKEIPMPFGGVEVRPVRVFD